MAKKKSWQEISKEPQQIEKRRAKDAAQARSAAHKREQLEKGMLARNTALNKMGYNGAGHLEVYKTQAASFGVETTPAPIETIDARIEPAEITEYPERPGGGAGAPQAAFPQMSYAVDSQAGLIATRMRRARAVLRTAIGHSK